MREWRAGAVAEVGTFECASCEYQVSLKATDEVPICPRCYGTRFIRSSLFADLPTVKSTDPPRPESGAEEGWVDKVRAGLDAPGQYVAYRTLGGHCVGTRLRPTTTRIGRSGNSHIRFDDPTVSRRHALILCRPNGFYILDDRSLNGVFVNGERVEWSLLDDGDEIFIGRHELRFITVGRDDRAHTARRRALAAAT